MAKAIEIETKFNISEYKFYELIENTLVKSETLKTNEYFDYNNILYNLGWTFRIRNNSQYQLKTIYSNCNNVRKSIENIQAIVRPNFILTNNNIITSLARVGISDVFNVCTGLTKRRQIQFDNNQIADLDEVIVKGTNIKFYELEFEGKNKEDNQKFINYMKKEFSLVPTIDNRNKYQKTLDFLYSSLK